LKDNIKDNNVFMPFLRLIAIYAFVALVVFAVFNRDQVMPLIGLNNTEQGEDLPPIPAELPEAEDATPVAENPDALPPMPPAPEKPETKVVEDADAGGTKAGAGTDATADPTPALQTPTPVAAEEGAAAAVPAAVGGKKVDDLDARLAAARKAFWSGETETAEKIYLQLAAAYPDNADIRGELGNLYYNAVRMKDAARMYFEAGKILRKSGQSARLGAVIAALRGISPDLAAQLAPATAPEN